ncbi:MAG: hypothetical protein WCS08_00735 [Eubacteriales bacterium]|nr:hypothetical protein [Clostridia bacterium]
MVLIDDSGSGSLIGGTCIGAIRTETMEYVYDFISIEFYNKENFKSKKYLAEANSIVFSLLNRLNYNRDEEISICQGYMFELARANMDKRNIKYTSTKIEEPLQSLIENTFQDYALGLGLPPQYAKYTKYPLHFHRILRWVYSDYKKRVPLCKTGWKSWSKYGTLNLSRKKDVIYANNYICLRCGFAIETKSKVERLEYTSNCKNTIYLHLDC